MPTQKLTKRSVDAEKSADRDCFYWDDELRGFGLKVTPANSKIYLVQYRMGGRTSSTRRYRIGDHGTWPPLQRGRTRSEFCGRLATTGIGPLTASKDKERLEQELKFSVYAERFLSEYGRRHWRPRTYASAESNIRRWLVPVLGSKALPNITRRDMMTTNARRLPSTRPIWS